MDYSRIRAVAEDLAYAFGDPVSIGPWSLTTTDLRPYPTTA
jgi:hypothetical protein